MLLFARNVSVFHLASQQKAEFLEKFVKINNILLSTQCKQDIQVHFYVFLLNLILSFAQENICEVTYHWEDWWWYEQWGNIKESSSGK